MGRFKMGAALLGAAGGALAVFLLDPDRGRSRRARFADQAAAVIRRGGRRIERARRMVASTAEGKAEAIRHLGSGDTPANDAALTDKVETELFRDPSIPKGSININAEKGVVVLRGEVADAGEVERIEAAVRRIPGVWEVRNLLHPAGTPAVH